MLHRRRCPCHSPSRLDAFALVAAVAVLLFAARAGARTPCDVAGADATSLSAARDAIDAACVCADDASRHVYRDCASRTLRDRIEAETLAKSCRREAMRYVTSSVCGRPGAVVCCRVAADGDTRHRVVNDAAFCADSGDFTSCVSAWQSVVTGCDADGCAPLCGDGTVEDGEECDPPDGEYCDGECQTIDCETVPDDCGNGTVDDGETCEPPGVGACGRDCLAAACAVPAAGEIEVACVEGSTTTGLAATPAGYLAAWSGPHRRDGELLVRRFDTDGVPTDATLTVASDETECETASGDPSVASDGTDYYVVWSANGWINEPPGAYFEAMYGRTFPGAAGSGAVDQLAFNIPFGSCRSVIFGPTMAAAIAPARFAVGWQDGGVCVGGLIYQNPYGALLDFNGSMTRTDAELGYPVGAPPNAYSVSGGSVDSLDGATLWAWHALYAESQSGPFADYIAAVWTDGDGNTSPFVLTSRQGFVGASRPAVAAGADSLLVAWSQGATDEATIATEIRAVRATRADDSIDPDGGLLLATTATAITAGPVVAFDGARWLVVWAEAFAARSDLRAVAVDADGSVVDLSPRLVAEDVTEAEPAVASAETGGVLVLFARPDGANSALRAVLVEP